MSKMSDLAGETGDGDGFFANLRHAALVVDRDHWKARADLYEQADSEVANLRAAWGAEKARADFIQQQYDEYRALSVTEDDILKARAERAERLLRELHDAQHDDDCDRATCPYLNLDGSTPHEAKETCKDCGGSGYRIDKRSASGERRCLNPSHGTGEEK